MYFYKKVEIDIFFKYSDFGQGESTLTTEMDHYLHNVLFVFHISNKRINSKLYLRRKEDTVININLAGTLCVPRIVKLVSSARKIAVCE